MNKPETNKSLLKNLLRNHLAEEGCAAFKIDLGDGVYAVVGCEADLRTLIDSNE